jgi:hypothetical protein
MAGPAPAIVVSGLDNGLRHRGRDEVFTTMPYQGRTRMRNRASLQEPV